MKQLVVIGIIFFCFTQEGVVSAEETEPSSGCWWTWSPWTECDPGSCASPRNERDRIRIILQAPLKRMNESCTFSIGHLQSPDLISVSQQSQDSLWVESEPCTTGEPCYWSNSSCQVTGSDTFHCNSDECIPDNLVDNGDYDCADGSDESSYHEKNLPCPKDIEENIRPVPNTYVWSYGRDLLYRKPGKPVLNEGFHGTCDIIPNTLYRKQYNIEDVSPLVDVQDIRTVSSFVNWVSFTKYLQNILKFSEAFTDVYNVLEDFENVTFHEGVSVKLLHRLKLKQSKDLLLKHEFEEALRDLPKTYSHKKYFEFFKIYGTHYFEEAILGGAVRVYFAFEANKYERKEIEQSIYNFMDYLNGNSTLRGTYDILRKARFQRFVVTGGKTQFKDLNTVTLRRFNQKLYTEWQESLKFYPEVVDVSVFNVSGDIYDQLSTRYVPLSRLLEGSHVMLENKISIWENLEKALEDYQQPYLEPQVLCAACPESHEAFIVPDVYSGLMSGGDRDEKQYGCVCATKDGRLPQEVAIVEPDTPLTSIAKFSMIGVGSLLGVILIFVIIDWCTGWKIIRCECKKHKISAPYDDVTDLPSYTRNGRQPQNRENGKMKPMLADPEIFMTEVDESGIERDVSQGRLLYYADVEYDYNQ